MQLGFLDLPWSPSDPCSVAASAPTGDTPTRVGRYEILSHIATGGMARIYLARAGGIGSFERYVVLKTISPDRAGDQRFVTMFLDEARLAATLNHQNIAQVYEVDEADGNLFITMEYVHGENLRTILEMTLRKGWTIPIELAVMIVSSAAAGLHHAHERKGKAGQPLNIVHRDVSPANIMVGYDGSVKLLDFGIAKAEERSTKTQQGTIKGKYGYMSPEQCRGKPIDRRSDIFALGIVLYEITTLRRAFRGNDDFDTMKRIVNGDLVPPSVAVPGYPRELEAIVLTAMARDPEYRFQTTQEMLEALDAFMVRAKLSGSPSAMARFMTQLFGTKREPWVEIDRSKRASEPPTFDGRPPLDDKTEVSDGRHDVDSGDSLSEATAILEQNAPTLRDGVRDPADSVTTSPTRATGLRAREADPAAADTGPWTPAAPPPDLEPEPRPSPKPTDRMAGVPVRSSGRIAPPAEPRPRPADAAAKVPSLRPNRTAMWILVTVVIIAVGVVGGSIALGLLSQPTPSRTPAPAPAPDPGPGLPPGSGSGSGS